MVQLGVKNKDLTMTFTGDGLRQIRDLQKFIGAGDPLDVLKLGISLVQKIKETYPKK